MSVGAALYHYRKNFGCKQKSKANKGRKTTIQLFTLILKGNRTVSRFDDDYFVSLCQWLMKNGYPMKLSINHDTSKIDEFFMDALFSVDPFFHQYLYSNRGDFDIIEWRKQFELFEPITITDLNFYRSRQSMPLPNFSCLRDVYAAIFQIEGSSILKLNFSFNSSWPEAVWILEKRCLVDKEKFTYEISYGCEDDYIYHKKGISCSAWSISIQSEIGENYVDFLSAIQLNYDGIISGNKDVLQSIEYDDHEENFYLGGNFKLRNRETKKN